MCAWAAFLRILTDRIRQGAGARRSKFVSPSSTRALPNADTNCGHNCTYQLMQFFRLPGSLSKTILPWGRRTI